MKEPDVPDILYRGFNALEHARAFVNEGVIRLGGSIAIATSRMHVGAIEMRGKRNFIGPSPTRRTSFSKR
jgi:hypothetical protein